MSAEVIKHGTKSFWKTKSTIDILVVEHQDCDVLEIVCFDPITNQEAPHIYVLRSKLVPLICDEEIQYRLFELQEPIRQRHGVIDNEALLKIAWNDAIYDYIDEKLELHKLLAGSKAFRVNLRKPLPNEGPQAADLMCCAPASLIPYELDHYTAPRLTVIEEAKESAIEPKKIVKTIKAIPNILNVPTTLTARQRWRIPIIFTKVFNGNRLKMADRIIWKVVALNLLNEADPHERMAIANFESPTLCIDFAARRKAIVLLHKSDQEAEQTYGIVRPAPITIGALDAYGHGPHTKPSPKPTTTPHTTPASQRFTDPAPLHAGSFKFGISALSSSLQRGLNSFGHSLDTKNKHYRAAAGADLAAESPTTATPKYRRDTHHPSPVASQIHSRTGATPRGRHGHGANGRSPHQRQFATPRAPHNTPQHYMAAGKSTDDTESVSQSSDLHRKSMDTDSPSNREWFAVSLSRKLAGFVSNAISGSSKHRNDRVHASNSGDDKEEIDDFASIGHASSTGPVPDSVVATGQSELDHTDLHKKSRKENADGTRTPPPLSSRPQSREQEAPFADAPISTNVENSNMQQPSESDNVLPHHANQPTTNNSHPKLTNSHTKKHPKKQDPKTKKASSPISGAIGALISNLSGKNRTHKSPTKKQAHSPTHHETENETHNTISNNSTTNTISPTPAEGGPVQKFYQLITLRGRNVVIRPAVNIPHDTVVLYY